MFRLFGPKRDNYDSVQEDLEEINLRLEILTEVNKELVGIINKQRVFDLITKRLAKKVKMNFPSIWIYDEKEDMIKLESHSIPKRIQVLAERAIGKPLTSIGFDRRDPRQGKSVYFKVIDSGKPYFNDDLYTHTYPYFNNKIAKALQSISGMKLAISIPIIVEDKVLGILSAIWKENSLSKADELTLNSFADQIAIAIYNANLYDKVQKQLQELASKNLRLESLYNLTSTVSQTPNPEKVLQAAVNAIPLDNELLGVAVLLYETETKKLSIKATTQSELARKAEEIVGEFSNYELDLSNPTHRSNILFQTIREGTPKEASNISDLLSPIVPKSQVDGLNRILRINHIAMYPLLARGEPLGAIVFFLKLNQDEKINEEKQQLYLTYSSQLSIALENALLFTKSQEISNNLREARQRERDMVDVMGHELRTPITIVRNALMSMIKDYSKDGKIEDQEKLGRYLDMAIESTKREIRLIETLLSATKVDGNRVQLDLTKVDLTDVINDSLEANKGAIKDKPRLKVQFHQPDPNIFIYTDRVRIQEIIDNILSNAIKYTSSGEIEITTKVTGREVWIRVKDTGIGINKEDIEKLGHKFFRAKALLSDNPGAVQPSGTGLGLFVSFNLIKLLNGSKKITSVPGKGSVFSFSQPLYNKQKNKRIEGSIVS